MSLLVTTYILCVIQYTNIHVHSNADDHSRMFISVHIHYNYKTTTKHCADETHCLNHTSQEAKVKLSTHNNNVEMNHGSIILFWTNQWTHNLCVCVGDRGGGGG